jgi:transglutaminase-like putative cysteine protease
MRSRLCPQPGDSVAVCLGLSVQRKREHLASHAWAEAWLDDAWYSFDVTNELARPERHLKLAVGLDYLDACPVRGMRRGGGANRCMRRCWCRRRQHFVQQQ